ncbi:hypothetical protein FACS189468_7410 [Spirochaetia bacterium]|nr:hypothetical protein FACS189468_7410 [Spirochaetia bacterium]
MKKGIVFFLLFVLFSAGMLSAQPWGRWGAEPRGQPEQITVTGNLGLEKGRIALKDGNNIYYVFGIQRYIGFIDGLKEGASVTVDGSAVKINENPEARIVRVSKLTISGRVYDLAPADNERQNAVPGQGSDSWGPSGNWGPGGPWGSRSQMRGPGNRRMPGPGRGNRCGPNMRPSAGGRRGN